MANWSSMSPEDEQRLLNWADKQLSARWTLGDQRYKSSSRGFQGNPLDHAIEEALDLLVYLWVAKRKEQDADNPDTL